MSETDLITRALQGDGAAWEALVRQHQEPAFRLAYLILDDVDEAEDVTQEAFIRAYRAIESYDSSRPFRPWLLTITANLARNQKRSLGRYLSGLQRFIERNPETMKAHNPERLENEVSKRWESQSMRKAIQRLDDNDQQIIYLRYFLELPVAETAQVLDVAEGTVKSRLYRALGRLQGIIEREFSALRDGYQT